MVTLVSAMFVDNICNENNTHQSITVSTVQEMLWDITCVAKNLLVMAWCIVKMCTNGMKVVCFKSLIEINYNLNSSLFLF